MQQSSESEEGGIDFLLRFLKADFMAKSAWVSGRHGMARLCHLTIPGRRSATALAAGLKAGSVAMPIPFGNLLPALALVLIGLGQRVDPGLGIRMNGTDR